MRILTYLLIALPALGSDPWRIAASKWTEADAHRILSASPWARTVGRSKVTVRWESSRPVRLALARLQQKPIVEDDAWYAISVVGLKTPLLGSNARASLRATGRKAITAIGSRMQDDRIVFLFPRLEDIEQPIVFRLPLGVKIGNAIEFETRVGSQIVKQRFFLRNMKYEGRPEF